jgi:hypothetical protein
MRCAACLAVLLVCSGAILAAPVDDGARRDRSGDDVRRSRSEAREAYGKRRRARRESIEENARFPSGGPGAAVPGWREARIAPDSKYTPEEPVPPAARRYGRLMSILVGGTILLLLILRIHLPWLFSLHLLRHLRAAPRTGPEERVPQTVALRPRIERLRHSPAADPAHRVNP